MWLATDIAPLSKAMMTQKAGNSYLHMADFVCRFLSPECCLSVIKCLVPEYDL
jgi:hypothetical protein